MFELKAFIEASVAGVPLIAVVLGLVTWLAQTFKLQGQQKLIASMITGLLLGAGYQLSIALPATYAGWFAVVIYGLALGLIASGIYDTGKKLAGGQVEPPQ